MSFCSALIFFAHELQVSCTHNNPFTKSRPTRKKKWWMMLPDNPVSRQICNSLFALCCINWNHVKNFVKQRHKYELKPLNGSQQPCSAESTVHAEFYTKLLRQNTMSFTSQPNPSIHPSTYPSCHWAKSSGMHSEQISCHCKANRPSFSLTLIIMHNLT